MTVERDIAGFVLPFSAGIFLFAGIGFIDFSYFHIAGTVSFLISSCILLAMMHPVHFRFRRDRILVAILGLSAGIFIGVTSRLMDFSSVESGLISWASEFGQRLGDFIDKIPFGDSGPVGSGGPAAGGGLSGSVDSEAGRGTVVSEGTAVSGQTNALIKALVTGERNNIARSVADAFRESGASHILALSGFHLGIVYGIIRILLSFFGNTPWISRLRSLLTISLCGFYTLATGAGPSIVRAFLFILLGETARHLHRHRSTGSTLLSALLIQLIINPLSIRTVSFQLSYAAMAGIAWIYPHLRDFWPNASSHSSSDLAPTPSSGLFSEVPLLHYPITRILHRIWNSLVIPCLRWIWNSAALSIACQLTTGPLAWLYFGTFPQHFLLTNLLAIPLTSLLIPSALLTLALTALDICPQFLLHLTHLLAQTLITTLETIAIM